MAYRQAARFLDLEAEVDRSEEMEVDEEDEEMGTSVLAYLSQSMRSEYTYIIT